MPGAGILPAESKPTVVSHAPLKIIVPGGPGILESAENAVVGNLVLANYST